MSYSINIVIILNAAKDLLFAANSKSFAT